MARRLRADASASMKHGARLDDPQSGLMTSRSDRHRYFKMHRRRVIDPRASGYATEFGID
jgi:hypothetical protein